MRKKLFIAVFLLFTVVLSASATEPQKAVVFAIDISGSMKGVKLQTTKESVKKVIQSLNSDKPAAIIGFNQEIEVVQSPTLDRELIQRKTNELLASGETSLYDAINFALKARFPEGIDQIVLLSDGEDSASKITLSNLIEFIKINSVKVDTIGIQVSLSQEKVLTQIANASGGNFYKVDEISSLLDTYKTILRKDILKPNTSDFSKTKTNELKKIHVFFGISSFILAIYLLSILRKIYDSKNERKSRLRNLVIYSRGNVKKTNEKLKVFLKTYTFVPKKIERKLKDELDAIHSNMKYETIINIIVISWIFLFLVLSLLSNSIIMAFLFSILLIYFGFKTAINRIKTKNQLEFDNNLPEMLNLLASALRSGLTLNQSLEAYSAEASNEVALQMRRAMSEVRLGSSIDEALMKVAIRMKSEDLKWAVTALSIQKVVGGSMASILSTTYETINSRTEIRREVRTLSAEGRLSAYILIALPIGMFFYLLLTRRDYAFLLFTNPIGILLSIISIVLLTVGWRWIKSIVNIKI